MATKANYSTGNGENLDRVQIRVKDGYVEQPAALDRLGISFTLHFMTPSTEPIPQAVEDEARRLNNLGISSLQQFVASGSQEDINNAIHFQEQAVIAASNDTVQKHICLTNLGVSVLVRFEQSKAPTDITRALTVLEDAIKATPQGHEDRHMTTHNLGVAIIRQYETSGELADLNKAITAQESAVDCCSDSHADKPMYLHNLSMSLTRRFKVSNEIHDIERAISLKEDAVSLDSQKLVDKPRFSGLNISDVIMRYIFASRALDYNHVDSDHQLKSILEQPNDNPLGLWVIDGAEASLTSLVILPLFDLKGRQIIPDQIPKHPDHVFYNFLDFLKLAESQPERHYSTRTSFYISHSCMLKLAQDDLISLQTAEDSTLMTKWETEPTTHGWVSNAAGMKDSTLALMTAALLSHDAAMSCHPEPSEAALVEVETKLASFQSRMTNQIPAGMVMFSAAIWARLSISFRGFPSTNNRSGSFVADFWGVGLPGIGNNIGNMLFNELKDLNGVTTTASYEWRALVHYVESENASGGGNRMEYQGIGANPATALWGSGYFSWN